MRKRDGSHSIYARKEVEPDRFADYLTRDILGWAVTLLRQILTVEEIITL